jgi:DNA-directed RNA polymerase subunit L
MSAREPKKTIESTIKETLFAKIEEQATLIETLKNEITELKQVQLSAVEEVKPILHNPESRTEKRPVMKQTANHTMTAQERILNKLYN